MEKQTQIKLELNDREIVLLGTAHVSQSSILEVEQAIEEQMPEAVAVELDDNRCKNIEDPDVWKNMDIIEVLKKKQGFLLLANIILSSYQRKMGGESGINPGQEMMAALKKADSLNMDKVLVDRSVTTTLRRAWANTPSGERLKLLSLMCASAFDNEKVNAEDVEDLKKNSEMDSMMSDLSHSFPAVKEVLIDERDRYIASKIWNSSHKKILAVIGIGHMNGVRECLEKLAAEEMDSDVSKLDVIPEKSKKSKAVAWIIPALIVGLIAAGFVFGGIEKGKELLSSWVLWNGILAGVGALIGGGHIVTVLVSVVGAPFTSLCPFIGIGFVSGIVQALIKKPTVADVESLQTDTSSIKGFYRNRILRVLLVFFLSSVGSSIGTFAGGASFVAILSSIFSK